MCVDGNSQLSGSPGSKCNVSPSNSAISQFTLAPAAAFFSRAISRPLTPALPPFNWMRRMSKRSESFRPRRKAMASIMPVRGAPLTPSKNATRHPRSVQYAFGASLLAASAAWAFANAFLRLRVSSAFAPAARRFPVRAAFCPAVSSSGTSRAYQNARAS